MGIFEEFIASIEEKRFDYEIAESLDDAVNHQDVDCDPEYIDRILSYIGNNIYMDVWIYSFVLNVFPSGEIFHQFVQEVYESKELDWQNKYFISAQLTSLLFQTP